jgi:tetratricopeptide (TPR) repeat protein
VAILCVFGQSTGASHAATPSAARTPASEAAWVLAKAALAEFQAGRYARSAELYGEAWRADPAQPGYLFGVGRAEQKAGHWQAAIAAYERLLTLLPAADPIAARARQALKIVKNAAAATVRQPEVASPPASVTPAPVEIARTATPEALSAPPTPAVASAPPAVLQVRPVAQVSATAEPSGHGAAWLAAGVGALCLLGAGATAWNAGQADRDADHYRLAGSSRFDPVKISETAASARVDTINTGRGIAIGLALVAVAATAVSAWLFRSDRVTTRTTKAIP